MSNNDKIMKIGQGCDSKECKEKYKNEFLFKDECPATGHELNLTKKEIKCLICGKLSKIKG